MFWSVSLIVMASLGANDAQTTYDSYTKAYWMANAVHRPMLVILNPASEEVSQQDAISLELLRQDERTRNALDNYVVAVIDTGTEHGKEVHGLFGSPQLPRVVVIDERQAKQVYQSSNPLPPAEMASVLEQHRTNAVIPVSSPVVSSFPTSQPVIQGSFNAFQSPPGNCPNCRNN